MNKCKFAFTALLSICCSSLYANCVGYSGPGGPCSTGPGGGLYTGPGGGAYTGPGGEVHIQVQAVGAIAVLEAVIPTSGTDPTQIANEL